MKLYILLTFLIALPLQTLANTEAPPWITQGKPEDSQFKYYIGRAQETEEVKLFEMAYRNAVEQAIRENFGVKTKIETQTYEDLDKATATRRVDELSQLIEIRDFEQTDFYKKENSIWILFKYSKLAIQKERNRLAEIKKHPQNEASSVNGKLTSNNKGSLHITSDIECEIFIDDTRWGETPLKLNGKLTPGKHRIQFEHPHYDSIIETLIIPPNSTISIHKNLTKAKGSVFIKTNPADSKITINQQIYKSGEEISLTSGELTTIKIEHNSTDTIITQVELSKYEKKELTFNLTPKPAYLSILTQPPGAEVYINASKVGITPIKNYKIDSLASYKIEIRKEGFESEFYTPPPLSAGERRTLPIFKLKKLSEIVYKNDQDEQEFKITHAIGLGSSYFGTTSVEINNNILTFFDLYFEKRLFQNLGLKTNFSYGLKKQKFKNGDLSIAPMIIKLSTPFYLFSQNPKLFVPYFEPAFQIHQTIFKFQKSNSSTESEAVINQLSTALNIGLQWRIDFSPSIISGFQFYLGVSKQQLKNIETPNLGFQGGIHFFMEGLLQK